ncbi:MAG: hypothetical protein U0104_06260 [Gemmatimonadales bacterium]
MRRLLRPLLGLVLAVVCTANALAPGLHGCERREPAAAGMAGHHGMAEMPAGHQHGAPERSAPHRCDCVGHACCFAPMAPPAVARLALPPVAVVAVAAPQGAPTLVVVRPDRLLPLAQAPPAPLA